MADRNREFRTGERAVDACGYICEAGIRRDLREGDEFPACPQTGRETTWRRENDR